jgi:NAD(P)-dependent dehydrogenase (short-subunit alcohol dehydrogenase family)
MSSHPDFGKWTEASTVATAFPEQIKGKTILITGVSPNGLGESTAEALAAHEPALLILTGRTKSKVQAVIESLTQKYPTGRYRFLELDLSSLAAVRKAAEEVKAYPDVPDIDIIICNAGVMWLPQQELSVDGVEMQFATNHLGHFLFVNLIVEKLIAAAQKSAPGAVRIINVSSLGAQFSPIRFSDINFTKAQPDMPEGEQANLELMKAYGMPTEGIYNPITAYGQSKTANSLFSLELTHRLFEKYKIKSYTLHPGGILTDLWRHTDDQLLKQLVAGQEAAGGFKTLKQGSSTTLVAALDPSLPEATPNGDNLYLDDCQFIEITSWARDAEGAEKLWQLSESLVGQKFPK